MNSIPREKLGGSEVVVSRIALGLWPIAGMTTLGANESDSLATIDRAMELGINFFDTAFCYGTDGISERLLGRAIADDRDKAVVATKGGVHWASDGSRVNDASPKRLLWEFEESLRRLETDYVDLLYLHSPDRITPIETSAEFYCDLRTSGRVKAIGLSNATLAEIEAFHSTCALDVIQPRYNMLQRDIEEQIVPWCISQNVSIASYWPLMKGLLAGKIRRDFQFAADDKRKTYEIFQSPRFDWTQDLLDVLDGIARELETTIAALVVAWTLRQPGITSVLCGAKRAWQIDETAQASLIQIPDSVMHSIDSALSQWHELAAD
ncbi:MAG: aldo/keto reductase [Pirellulaceae bacterium]